MQENNTNKLTRSKIVIDSLRDYYGEKVGEFAKRLGVAGSTVSTWANRDSLDEDLIYRKCKGVRYDFLTTGKGDLFDKDQAHPPDQITLKIIQMLEDMPEDRRRDVLRYAEEKKLLAELLADRGNKKQGGAA